MEPVDTAMSSEVGGQVEANARVASVAERIVRAERPFAVVDGSGKVIGRLDRDRVIDILASTGERDES
jgi:glycine betaine/proline transport system ATP-binding protein